MKKIRFRRFAVATAVAGTAANALHDAKPDINVLHNTEAAVRGATTAANEANGEYQGAKTARLDATKTQRAASVRAVVFIRIVREMLKESLGGRYSQAWNEVGFVNQTLALPRTMGKRLGVLKSMELYFAAHPEREVAGVATSALAAALHKELVNAMSGFAAARTEVRQKKSAREAAVAALRERLQNLYRELQQFLKPNDPRWIEFGFTVQSQKVDKAEAVVPVAAIEGNSEIAAEVVSSPTKDGAPVAVKGNEVVATAESEDVASPEVADAPP